MFDFTPQKLHFHENLEKFRVPYTGLPGPEVIASRQHPLNRMWT